MRLRNGTFLTLLLGCLCALFSLSWYGAFGGHKGKEGAHDGGRAGGALPPCALRLARMRAENPGPSGGEPRTTSQPKGPRNLLPCRSPPSPFASGRHPLPELECDLGIPPIPSSSVEPPEPGAHHLLSCFFPHPFFFAKGCFRIPKKNPFSS